MGFAPFIGNSGSDLAALAANNNKRKQVLIDQGTQMINAIYGGGSVPSFMKSSGAYDPTQTYYNFKDTKGYSVYNPNITTNDSNATLNRANHLVAKGKLYTAGPSTKYTGFTPQFFQDRAGAYERYATPQLGEQYNNASRSIDYGLADRGLYNSSAGMTARSNLTRENASQVQNVADEGRNQAQQLQTGVQNSYNQALGLLYNTADPQGASNQALSSAASFQVPSAFAPVGDAFANLASQYAINNQLSAYNQPLYYNPQQGMGQSNNSNPLPTN